MTFTPKRLPKWDLWDKYGVPYPSDEERQDAVEYVERRFESMRQADMERYFYVYVHPDDVAELRRREVERRRKATELQMARETLLRPAEDPRLLVPAGNSASESDVSLLMAI